MSSQCLIQLRLVLPLASAVSLTQIHIYNPNIIYTTLRRVQQIYYIHSGTEKQVQAYYVQFSFYRNVMHIVHVSG